MPCWSANSTRRGSTDRNFCTEGFFNDLNQRGAYSLIREHDNLRFTPLQATHSAVSCEAQGCVVSEQWVQLKSRTEGQEGLKLRRIRIQLDVPTRHGESELYLLSTVPQEMADAPIAGTTVPPALDD